MYVLQHGNAVSKEEDAARPLSVDGRRDIERIAAHLVEKTAHIDRVISSEKLRAVQTAKIVSDMLAIHTEPEAVNGLAPNDDPRQFIAKSVITEGAVLVVSHMPFVSGLCSMLLTGNTSMSLAFTPGTLARLDYSEGQWSLKCMLSPEHI